jgi:hypothetical protein
LKLYEFELSPGLFELGEKMFLRYDIRKLISNNIFSGIRPRLLPGDQPLVLGRVAVAALSTRARRFCWISTMANLEIEEASETPEPPSSQQPVPGREPRASRNSSAPSRTSIKSGCSLRFGSTCLLPWSQETAVALRDLSASPTIQFVSKSGGGDVR